MLRTGAGPKRPHRNSTYLSVKQSAILILLLSSRISVVMLGSLRRDRVRLPARLSLEMVGRSCPKHGSHGGNQHHATRWSSGLLHQGKGHENRNAHHRLSESRVNSERRQDDKSLASKIIPGQAMSKLQLHRRLRALFDLVPEGCIVADIGADHGILSTALATKCWHVHAIDRSALSVGGFQRRMDSYPMNGIFERRGSPLFSASELSVAAQKSPPSSSSSPPPSKSLSPSRSAQPAMASDGNAASSFPRSGASASASTSFSPSVQGTTGETTSERVGGTAVGGNISGNQRGSGEGEAGEGRIAARCQYASLVDGVSDITLHRGVGFTPLMLCAPYIAVAQNDPAIIAAKNLANFDDLSTRFRCDTAVLAGMGVPTTREILLKSYPRPSTDSGTDTDTDTDTSPICSKEVTEGLDSVVESLRLTRVIVQPWPPNLLQMHKLFHSMLHPKQYTASILSKTTDIEENHLRNTVDNTDGNCQWKYSDQSVTFSGSAKGLDSPSVAASTVSDRPVPIQRVDRTTTTTSTTPTIKAITTTAAATSKGSKWRKVKRQLYITTSFEFSNSTLLPSMLHGTEALAVPAVDVPTVSGQMFEIACGLSSHIDTFVSWPLLQRACPSHRRRRIVGHRVAISPSSSNITNFPKSAGFAPEVVEKGRSFSDRSSSCGAMLPDGDIIHSSGGIPISLLDEHVHSDSSRIEERQECSTHSFEWTLSLAAPAKPCDSASTVQLDSNSSSRVDHCGIRVELMYDTAANDTYCGTIYTNRLVSGAEESDADKEIIGGRSTVDGTYEESASRGRHDVNMENQLLDEYFVQQSHRLCCRAFRAERTSSVVIGVSRGEDQEGGDGVSARGRGVGTTVGIVAASMPRSVKADKRERAESVCVDPRALGVDDCASALIEDYRGRNGVKESAVLVSDEDLARLLYELVEFHLQRV